jgi:hypothetical protein
MVTERAKNTSVIDYKQWCQLLCNKVWKCSISQLVICNNKTKSYDFEPYYPNLTYNDFAMWCLYFEEKLRQLMEGKHHN